MRADSNSVLASVLLLGVRMLGLKLRMGVRVKLYIHSLLGRELMLTVLPLLLLLRKKSLTLRL